MSHSGVVEAHYLFDTPTIYEADPLAFDASDIHFELRGYALTARGEVPWPSVAEARRAVEAVLRSWRLQHQLTQGYALFDFRFQRVTVTGSVADLADYPSEPLGSERDDKGPLIISHHQYPRTPQIIATEELEAAAERLNVARLEFGESLESAAYFALTLAEQLAGDRKAAADQFGVRWEVLQQIGRLASTRGTLRTARKAMSGLSLPLNAAERQWLQLAVRTLLLHIGIAAAGTSPPRIGLADLPSLTAVQRTLQLTADLLIALGFAQRFYLARLQLS